MKPVPAKQRSTQSVNKRKRELPATVKVQDVQRTLQATTARSQHVDLGLLATPSSDVDDDTSGVLHPEVIDEPAVKRPEHETPDSSQPGSCHSSHTTRSNETHHLLSVATTQRSAYARRECGTQTLKRNFSITFCERRQWRRKEMMLQARVERLKQTLDKYKEELRLLKEVCKVDSFLEVVQEADARAEPNGSHDSGSSLKLQEEGANLVRNNCPTMYNSEKPINQELRVDPPGTTIKATLPKHVAKLCWEPRWRGWLHAVHWFTAVYEPRLET
ncbi:unnamed protein product [Ixodes pacificus]